MRGKSGKPQGKFKGLWYNSIGNLRRATLFSDEENEPQTVDRINVSRWSCLNRTQWNNLKASKLSQGLVLVWIVKVNNLERQSARGWSLFRGERVWRKEMTRLRYQKSGTNLSISSYTSLYPFRRSTTPELRPSVPEFRFKDVPIRHSKE